MKVLCQRVLTRIQAKRVDWLVSPRFRERSDALQGGEVTCERARRTRLCSCRLRLRFCSTGNVYLVPQGYLPPKRRVFKRMQSMGGEWQNDTGGMGGGSIHKSQLCTLNSKIRSNEGSIRTPSKRHYMDYCLHK